MTHGPFFDNYSRNKSNVTSIPHLPNEAFVGPHPHRRDMKSPVHRARHSTRAAASVHTNGVGSCKRLRTDGHATWIILTHANPFIAARVLSLFASGVPVLISQERESDALQECVAT
jgi:hypothetical protein